LGVLLDDADLEKVVELVLELGELEGIWLGSGAVVVVLVRRGRAAERWLRLNHG
jgi:hypothetical protein